MKKVFCLFLQQYYLSAFYADARYCPEKIPHTRMKIRSPMAAPRRNRIAQTRKTLL